MRPLNVLVVFALAGLSFGNAVAQPHAGPPPRAQVIAEAQRMRSTFGTPVRGARMDAASRRRASDSFAWLARTGHYYRRDPLVSAALMETYGVLGDYYAVHYPAYAWYAYAGANRWARWQWWNYSRTPVLQRDLERFALAWATVAGAQGSWFWRPEDVPQDQDFMQEAPGAREIVERVPVPEIDEAGLSPLQREAWRNLRTQFVFISSKVHQTRLILDDLARSLVAQGLTLNAHHGAIAISMQSFLVDAADLAREHEFERAMEALQRADYERGRLRSVVGR